MVKINHRNVINVFFDHLILKCVFKKKSTLSLFDVMKLIQNVYLGLNTVKFDRRSESY